MNNDVIAEIDRLAAQREHAKRSKIPWSDIEREIVEYGRDKIRVRTLLDLLNASNRAAGRPQRRSLKALSMFMEVLKHEPAEETENQKETGQ